MKKIFFLLQICLLVQHSNATIRRVNNHLFFPQSGHYTHVQDALNAALPGDTIHIEPSSNTYNASSSTGYITVSTPNLTIIGNGLTTQTNNTVQADTNQSAVRLLYIHAAHTKVIGLHINNILYFEPGSDSSTVDRCVFRIVYLESVHDMKFTNCRIGFPYIEPMVDSNQTSFNVIATSPSPGASKRILFENNYITARIITDSSSRDFIFRYNVISEVATDPTNTYGGSVNHSSFEKNIFKSNNNFTSTNANANIANTFTDNVICTSLMNVSNTGTNSGNVTASVASVFANPTSNLDIDQQVLPSFSIQNVGMFAGTAPFNLNFIPHIPAIYQFTVPAVINSTTPSIIISTQSHQ